MPVIETMAILAWLASPSPVTESEDLFAQAHSEPGIWRSYYEQSEGSLFPSLRSVQETYIEPIRPQYIIFDKVDLLKAELSEYENLSPGWDGPESLAPTTSHIQSIKEVVESIPSGIPIPKPMISSNGEIGLYWNTDDCFADLVLEKDGKYSLFVRSKSGHTKEYYRENIEPSQISNTWLTEELQQLQLA